MNRAIFPAFVLCSFAISGCDFNKNDQKIENCWSPETKKTMTQIVNEGVNEEIINKINQDGTKIPPAAKNEILNRTKIELSNYSVMDSKPNVGRLTCAAYADFSYTRPDNSKIHANNVIEFDITKGETGFSYSFQRASLNFLLNNASE